MRFIPIFILIFSLFSCETEIVCTIDGIEVSASLSAQAQKTGFAYCSTLKKALQKEEAALQQLIRFAYKTDDYSAIDHGIVFAELSINLGDDFMSEFTKKQQKENKLLIAKMYDACMEYRNPQIILESKLTKTYKILMELE
jgi:hypothetical protein